MSYPARAEGLVKKDQETVTARAYWYQLFSSSCIYIYIYIYIIIIIMSCRKHGYPWPSLALCNCRLVSSSAVLLASKWRIHTAVSTRLLPGRNCVSFYRSGLISIWSIIYRLLSKASLAACRCLFRLMRHSFLGRWICLPVSEKFPLMWKYLLFD